MKPIGFDGVAQFLESQKALATDYLTRYFTSYTGRWFEHFSALSDPYHLDANDIAACATLSVEIDGSTVDRLMTRAKEIDELLERAPAREIALWDEVSTSEAYRAAGELYSMIREIKGMGPTRTSKLLASKRPHFVPIRDSIVADLLGADKEWWAPIRTVVSDPLVRGLIDEVTPTVVPEGASILRRLDVILWMHGSSM